MSVSFSLPESLNIIDSSKSIKENVHSFYFLFCELIFCFELNTILESYFKR